MSKKYVGVRKQDEEKKPDEVLDAEDEKVEELK